MSKRKVVQEAASALSDESLNGHVTQGSMQDLVLTAVEAHPEGLTTILARALVAEQIKTGDVERLSALVRGALFLLAKRGLVRVSGKAWGRVYYPAGKPVERKPGRPEARAKFRARPRKGWHVGASVRVAFPDCATASDLRGDHGRTIAKVTRHMVTLADGTTWSTADGAALDDGLKGARIERVK